MICYLQKELLLDELKFHRDIYALQSDSAAFLIASIKYKLHLVSSARQFYSVT